jgi:hypothetical protein
VQHGFLAVQSFSSLADAHQWQHTHTKIDVDAAAMDEAVVRPTTPAPLTYVVLLSQGHVAPPLRHTCTSNAELQALLADGWQFSKTFLCSSDGTRWLGSASTLSPNDPALTSVHHTPAPAAPAPAHLSVQQNLPSATIPSLTSSPATSSAPEVPHHMVSRIYEAALPFGDHDPSVGNPAFIYGVNIQNKAALESLFSLPGLPEGHVGQSMSMLADVTSLPGKPNHGTNTADEDTTQLLFLALQTLNQQVDSVDSLWKNRDAIHHIKSDIDLGKAFTDIRKAWKNAQTYRNSKVGSYLYKQGYQHAAVEAISKVPGIMHLNNTMYCLYLELLDKVRTLWFYQHPPAWKGSLSQVMLKHHATELLDKQTYSHSYVDFLLSTYVYLRDAQHERFAHTSMMEQLFLMPCA